jgi:hypothetical protein
MGHSKLPWKEEGFGNGYRGIVDADDKVVLVISWNGSHQEENIPLIVTACNQHDGLKAFACKAVDYFESECDECKTESINKYGKHGTEGCKSCLTGKLLIEAKGFK